MELNPWLEQSRLVVCVGSGGVGKTTTSAAIALWAAARGRKALVVTIDPARRLANSLGLDRIGAEEMRIDLSAIAHKTGVQVNGELWALMLDSRHTFDNVIRRIAPNPEVQERILANHIYRHMADTLAGSQDYMATEKLYDMVQKEKYDLIVLDTPPVKNALDFLESSGRVVNFLDERILSWFLSPPKSLNLAARLMAGTSTAVYWLLGQVFGSDFLNDLSVFFHDMQGLYEGFRHRHDAVMKLFREPTTSFVTVCGPTESSVDVAVFFQEALRSRGLPRAGVVVNQVHQAEGWSHDANLILGDIALQVSQDLPESTRNAVLARLGMAHKRLHELVVAEQVLEDKIRSAAAGGGFYQEVPRFDGEVHDVAALFQVGAAIFGTPASQL